MFGNEKTFWDWFSKNSKSIKIKFKKDSYKTVDELDNKLKEYYKNLYIEMSDETNGINELIITSGGNIKEFSNVEELVKSAPKIEGWKIIAFKPPKGFCFKMKYEGIELDPNKIYFEPHTNSEDPNAIGLKIFTDKLTKENKSSVISGIYILIDTGIGEYLSVTRIRIIDIEYIKELTNEKYLVLSKLQDYINYIDKREK